MSLVPLYRLQGHGDHFYTTSADERDNAVSQYGYVNEGIACYVNDAAPAPDAFWQACFVVALQHHLSTGGSAADVIAAAVHLANRCVNECR